MSAAAFSYFFSDFLPLDLSSFFDPDPDLDSLDLDSLDRDSLDRDSPLSSDFDPDFESDEESDLASDFESDLDSDLEDESLAEFESPLDEPEEGFLA
jgi:hypothetical protein